MLSSFFPFTVNNEVNLNLHSKMVSSSLKIKIKILYLSKVAIKWSDKILVMDQSQRFFSVARLLMAPSSQSC